MQHLRRCYFGSFVDPHIASTCEVNYLSKQLNFGKNESKEALGLLVWRKSTMYVVLLLSFVVVIFDVAAVYDKVIYWAYLGEIYRAPKHHAQSGLPPYDIPDDYMSEEALKRFHLPSPSTWTTLTGHVRDTNSTLCLGSYSDDIDSIAGLTRCSPDDKVHWLYGSDHNYYTYAKQLKLNVITDSLILPSDDDDSGRNLARRNLFDDHDLGGDPSSSQSPRTLASREPGISLNINGEATGICLSANAPQQVGDSALQILTIDLCNSSPMQGFELNAAGQLVNLHYGKCVSAAKASSYPQPPALHEVISLYLASCSEDENYIPIRFALPDNKRMDIFDLTPNATNVDVIVHDEPCNFLSNPKNHKWWPVYANQDTYKKCLKFSSSSSRSTDIKEGIVSKLSYRVSAAQGLSSERR